MITTSYNYCEQIQKPPTVALLQGRDQAARNWPAMNKQYVSQETSSQTPAGLWKAQHDPSYARKQDTTCHHAAVMHQPAPCQAEDKLIGLKINFEMNTFT